MDLVLINNKTYHPVYILAKHSHSVRGIVFVGESIEQCEKFIKDSIDAESKLYKYCFSVARMYIGLDQYNGIVPGIPENIRTGILHFYLSDGTKSDYVPMYNIRNPYPLYDIPNNKPNEIS